MPHGIIGAPLQTMGSGLARIVSGATLGLQADDVFIGAAGGGTVDFTVDFACLLLSSGSLLDATNPMPLAIE